MIELAGLALGALLAVVALALAVMHVLARVPFVKDSYPIRRLRPTSFTVEVFDDSALTQRIGPAITGLVRNRISVRGDRLGLDFVTGQRIVGRTLKSFKDLAVPVPSVSGTAGVALIVIGFLARTLPRRRFVLRGEMQPDGSAGPGISLALQDNGGEDSLTTVWAAPLEVDARGDGAYQRLAVPAAAWADHRLTTALTKRAPSQLLSKNADSWAFFRAGLECHRLGEDEPARSLYEQALGHDGSNLGALANLGLLERREPHFGRAEGLLKDALEELEGRHESRQHGLAYRVRSRFVKEDAESQLRNPDWYRIRYQLAALYLNRASFDKGGPALGDDLQRALGESKDLARVSVKMALPDRAPIRHLRIGRKRADRVLERSELSEFLLSTIVPSALTLLAGALLVDREQNPPVLRAFDELHSYEDVLDAIEKDKLDPDELVKFVERQRQLAPRVYYNLACYQAIRKESPKARKWLEQALLSTTITERFALLKIIERDRTLKQVTAGAEFMEELRSYLPPRSPVAGLGAP